MSRFRSFYLVLSLINIFIVLLYLSKSKLFESKLVTQELIPAHIIQTSRTKLNNSNTSSFVRLNPHYAYYSFNDQEADEFIKKNMPLDVVQVYMSMPKAILKTDFFRYIAVMILGGVYSDKDTKCLRPIDTWTDGQHRHVKFMVGLEGDNSSNWKGRARPLQLCQWTFASVPGHPILRNIIKKIVTVTPQMLLQKMSYDLVMNWTGPGMWSDVILDYLRDQNSINTLNMLSNLKSPVLIDDIYILPVYAFGLSTNKRSAQNSKVCVRHNFEGSWKRDKDMIRKPTT